MVSNWFGFSLVLVLDYFWTRFGYVADWFQIGFLSYFGMDVPNSRVKSRLRNESPIHMSQAGVRTSLMESCGLSFAVPDAPTVLTLRPELRSGPSGVLWDVFWVVESSLSWYCPPFNCCFFPSFAAARPSWYPQTLFACQAAVVPDNVKDE